MRVLYVTDSPTVSGAEHVWFGYITPLLAAGGAAHAFIKAGNLRLREALDARGTPYTTTSSFSSRLLETTADPRAIITYASAFRAIHRELRDTIRAFRPDVIHSISYPTSLYAAFAAAASGVPQVWHEHNIKRIHRVNRYLYRAAAASCAWVVGPSRAVTDNLARTGMPTAKLVPLYNGIDLARFSADDVRAAAVRAELGLAPGQPAIGLFGQMLPYKGHRTLIEALPAIRARFPAARVFFVGALENPPYEASLRAAMADRGVADVVSFTGWRGDVPHVMRAMDVCVVATTTPEPAALSLMETMAMGRPIVGTRTGGTPEIVQDGLTGRLFAPGDVDGLAVCLCELLDAPELRARMGAAGRARMESTFTEEGHVRAMFDLYERAARRR